MSEQDNIRAQDEDTEGHVFHRRTFAEDEDTEGHAMSAVPDADEDAEAPEVRGS